ncbi:hypothetical protein B484DRAFT_459485 [Ochromonadaceae sp. CCMP2298]|nr:hypothetical protein B484DRAFT_459485 [Ochromonadaceae sp. CCMP2298]
MSTIMWTIISTTMWTIWTIISTIMSTIMCLRVIVTLGRRIGGSTIEGGTSANRTARSRRSQRSICAIAGSATPSSPRRRECPVSTLRGGALRPQSGRF